MHTYIHNHIIITINMARNNNIINSIYVSTRVTIRIHIHITIHIHIHININIT